MKLISSLNANSNSIVEVGSINGLLFPESPTGKTIATHEEVQAVITQFGGAFQFKGDATAISQDKTTITVNGQSIVASSDNKGNVYQIEDKEYASNGTVWVELGFNIDLSGKVDKTTTIAGVDLQNDITKSELLTALNVADGAQVNVIETVKVDGTTLDVTNKAVNIDLSGKVDKVDGKELSTNDFTDALKTKLEGIATGAEVNVQSDWSVTDNTSDAYIANKPQNLVQDANYVHTDNNYTTAEKTKLGAIAEGAQVNVLESVKVDGTALTITDKAVDIDLATPLSGKVDKVEGKGLSTNDFTGALKTKLDGVATGAQVNVIEGVKLTDASSALTPDANKIVTIPAAAANQDGLMSSEDFTKLSGVESGAQVNIIETVKVNGTAQTVTGKAIDITMPTKLTDLTNDGNFVTDASYVHTDNNYTSTEKTKLSGIEAGAEVNIIEEVKVNGTALTPDANRSVNVEIPAAPAYTIVKDSTAETGFFATYHLTKDGVNEGTAINIPKDYLVKSASMKICETAGVPTTTPALAVGDPYLDFVVNTKDGSATDEHIYINVKGLVDVYTEGNGIDIANNVISVDTTDANIQGAIASGSTKFVQSGAIYTALEGKVDKVNGKGLSTEDYTTAEKTKLAGIEESADVNIIETVKVDGSALTPDANKAVNIDLSGKVDKVAGKGLSTNDFTDALKTKLDNIEATAEVNIIQAVKVDGAALTVDSTDRSVNIASGTTEAAQTSAAALVDLDDRIAGVEAQFAVLAPEISEVIDQIPDLATKDQLIEVEKVAAADITDLDDRVSNIVSNEVHTYLHVATSGTSATITEATHDCGTFPMVLVYQGYDVASASISVNASGDVTVSWTSDATASVPVRIRIMG